jgi:hypothetical protein
MMAFQKQMAWQVLELNGGRVDTGAMLRLELPPVAKGYADAQIDDYGGLPRRRFPWRPGVELRLQARFSHESDALRGTAGFGFWNAPFGDPRQGLPALPQAAWFFYGSEPNDLPLAPGKPGRGWFASTLDATTWTAWAMAPLAPPVLLLNQVSALRRRVWPAVQRGLSISFEPVTAGMTGWHDYHLSWQPDGCSFSIDGRRLLETTYSPRGPLGFVCWIDNQYMVASPRGRFAWGTLETTETQWLEVQELRVSSEQ